jgi:TolB-like protein
MGIFHNYLKTSLLSGSRQSRSKLPVSTRSKAFQFPFQSRGSAMLVVSLIILFIISGCSKRYGDVPAYWPFAMKEYENQSVGRFKSSYLAAQIDSYYRGVNPGPIGVTSFVNLDDIQSTSSFGRMYAEQLMSELSMRGYDVVELRHADALTFLADSGEFALSRDLGMVRRQRDLGAVLVGTYVVSPERVYVNSRLLDPATSRILSAGSVEMGITPEITRLVRFGNASPTLERIPVQHLGAPSYPSFANPYGMPRQMPQEEYYGSSSGFAPAPVMPSGMPKASMGW